MQITRRIPEVLGVPGTLDCYTRLMPICVLFARGSAQGDAIILLETGCTSEAEAATNFSTTLFKLEYSKCVVSTCMPSSETSGCIVGFALA